MPDPFASLADKPVWVCWREEERRGSKTKVPYSARSGRPASNTNPADWTTRPVAEERAPTLINGAEKGGIGVVLGAVPGKFNYAHLASIDLDSCIDEKGRAAAWAAQIVRALATYTEISPSERGLKLFFYIRTGLVREFLDLIGVDKGSWGCKRGIAGLSGADHGPGVELYTAGRYFTTTGQIWPSGGQQLALLDWDDLRALSKLLPQPTRITRPTVTRPTRSAARAASETETDRDNSRSGKAFRAAYAFKDTSYEDMRKGLRDHDDPDIRAWVEEKGLANGERELRRIWDKAEGDAAGTAEDNEEAEADDDDLVVYDLATDKTPVLPRPWLSYFSFCRSLLSMLTGPSGAGKSAVRILYLLALATGRMNLTGEHVHRPCRVLFVSFEEDLDEIRRRVRAAVKHYEIDPAEIAGAFLYVSIGARADDEKMMEVDSKGRIVEGKMMGRLRRACRLYRPDLTNLDPLIDTNDAPESDNNAQNIVLKRYARFAREEEIALDLTDHDRKGAADAGDQDRNRGASSKIAAVRLAYTLTTMTEKEMADFKALGAVIDDRRRFVRYDSAKVNLCPPQNARWFELIDVRLDNGDDERPEGDRVQVAQRWHPPEAFDATSTDELEAILHEIDEGMKDGQRYSNTSRAKEIAAWPVVSMHYPMMEEAQCRGIINKLINDRKLHYEDYYNPVTRKTQKGLRRPQLHDPR